MRCVIISEEKIINLGKQCLSNLRDFVNDEKHLEFNEVKRLRTLFFLACQKVVGEKQKSKENNSYIPVIEIINEVWNEKLQEKFCEALIYIKKSKVGDESKVEEIFNTIVFEKYSRMEFSLEETYRIFDLIKDGLDKCIEIDDYLPYKIKDFEKIYCVYKFCYKRLR